MEQDFSHAYRELEHRMRGQAESDGDVYLPNPEPAGPAQYILVCMEPSLGRWARSASEARERVASGFRNFLASLDSMLLHFAARHYLCSAGERYFITDFSKGAMLVRHAGATRADRYDRWYALLLDEIALVAEPGARIVAVGNAVSKHLRRRGFSKVTTVVHYSPLAGHARAVRLREHEADFRQFAASISMGDVLDTANHVIADAGVPPRIREQVFAECAKGQLSESRLRLVYCYKLDFEALKARIKAESTALVAT